MRYNDVERKKKNGVVYTPSDIAEFVSELMHEYNNKANDLDMTEILDPAIGEGELVIAMINSLLKRGCKKIKIVGYETDALVAGKTKKILEKLFPKIDIDIRVGDFLSEVEKGNIEKFDYVIANPPYIRTQILGSEKSQSISNKLGLNGRVDIYYAFLLYTSEVLKKTGVAGYITSNKFMTIKSGQSVRDYMLEHYSIKHVIDLGDTKLFDASVLPCVLIFQPGTTTQSNEVSFTTIYEEQNSGSAQKVKSLFDAINQTGHFELNSGKQYKIKQGKMRSVDKKEIWSIATKEDSEFLRKVEKNTWRVFSDLGKIRVGIKTTADNVFIGDDWDVRGQNVELLKPLITHRNAGQFIANQQAHWEVLYTHCMKDGKATVVDIDNYPNAKRYLEGHFNQLGNRGYVKKAKRKWFEIWVPQNPSSWIDRKVVFRDISEKPQFWLDESGAVVNGDCYWIDINKEIDNDLIYLLLAVANSSFIEKYYDIKFNNKLYSGKRRFQSQYVEQFPIPNVASAKAKKTISLIKKIISEGQFSNNDKEKIDNLVLEMFSF